jgi:hypothetical protein
MNPLIQHHLTCRVHIYLALLPLTLLHHYQPLILPSLSKLRIKESRRKYAYKQIAHQGGCHILALSGNKLD